MIKDFVILILILIMPGSVFAGTIPTGVISIFPTEPIKASFSYERGKRNGVVNTNNIGINLSYDSPINANWSGWSFNQTSIDTVDDKGFENAIGGGLKYNFFKGDNESFSLSCGPLGFYSDNKWSGLLSCRPKFTYYDLHGTYFYQPEISNWSNYISKGILGLGNFYYKIEYRPGSDYKNETAGIKKSWDIEL